MKAKATKASRTLIFKLLYAFLTLILINMPLKQVNAQCATLTPTFTATPTFVCGPGLTAVSFVNTSTGVNAATGDYDWYRNGVFFDNTSGLGAPINSSVNAVGTYTFMMIANTTVGAPCDDTTLVTVIVAPIPVAGFTFTPNNACAGTNVAFTNTSTGTFAGTTYSWNFGDGTPLSTATNPSHAYAAGGTYNVTLTMTNGAGCTSTFVLPVTALPIPVATIAGDDGDGNTTYCLLPGDPTTSETVVFTNTTTGAVSYSWNFGDGSPLSPVFSPTHVYASFGTYTVTMTATGANGCTSTATLTVVFEKFVSSSLTLSIFEYSGCAPHTLTTLTNLSVNANTYTWNFGDGTPPVTTTSIVPPVHTYTTGGSFTITLTASNSCNTATATISPIIIINGPTASFVPSTILGCAPQNVSFVNTSTGTSPANNYQWNMGNGNTYTNVTTPPVQTYPTQGTYTVTLIAGSACGFDTVTTTIVIDSLPVADITSNPLVGCSPLTVSTVNNSYGNAITYQWFVDGVFVSTAANLPNQVFTAPAGNTAVTHTISLTVSNHCGTDTDAETIVVHPAVVALFTPSTDTVCAGGFVTFTEGSFGDFLTWNWDFDEGTTSILQGPHTITYNTPGTYVISLTVNGFCGTSTVTHTLTVLPFPVAAFTPLPATGCNPLTVNFTNTSTLGAIYSWTFGTGSAPATSALFTPPPVTYTVNGTSTATLVVNALGCSTTVSVPITINPLPNAAFTVTPTNGCSPLTVTFNNTTPALVGNTFAWNFGDGTTTTAQNPPALVYTNTGVIDSVYTVLLTVTTASGCAQTVTQTVTVHPLPVADFTALPDTVCATTPIAFLNNSTGASTFSWNFGDGSPISIAMSPAHTYTAAGLYTAQLIATTAFGCKDTITHTVFVDPIPNANYNFSIECVGDSTQFTDLSTGAIVSWAWNFGDATSSTIPSPTHLYATNGTYNVVLTVTNTAGCTHNSSQLVTVNLVPVAGIGVSTTCLGTPTTFTDLTTGVPISWEWNFGDGTPVSNVQNPSHTYLATGTFTVQLIAFAGSGCSDTITTTVTVTPIPTANFTFVSVCMNDTTFFTSTSLGGPDTFVWNFGDGFTDVTNNPNPSHVYTVAGTYNVSLTAGYAVSGCTNVIIIPVVSNPRTVPNFTNNTPCFGAPTNFTDLTTNAPISWVWDFGDGSPSDFTQNPSHIYTAPGTYTVSLITENVFTCVDTFVTTITVFGLPVANYGFTTVCETFATSFTDASTFATLWQWNFGDGSPLDLNTSPTHIFPASGTYSVQLVVTNASGCTDTSIQNVTVNPNPVAAFNSTIACHTYANSFTDISTGAITWEWDFGDGSPLDINQNTTHIYPIDGTYPVELEVTNVFGCSDSITQNATVLLQPQSAFTNTTVCAGQTAAFNDITTGAPTTWFWDFGDGSATTTLQNPTHIFTTGGTYNISLITGNIGGCLDTLIMPVNVFTVPTPDFTADTVCLFNITTFTDLSTDAAAITNWFWDFGDGNNSFMQNPIYIYTAAGTYNVTLTVTNINGCDSSITIPVIVNVIPVAAFIADTACVGSPTNFTDISTGAPTSWLWDFGDGVTSTTGPTVAHTYAAAGTYLVNLIVTGGTGTCFDQTFAVVTVSNTVVAGLTVEDTACIGEVLQFTDNSVSSGAPITSYFWDFGDGTTSALTNPTHAYTGPGTYTVTHTVSVGGGCSSAATFNILVANNPNASFAVTNGCLNQNSSFTSTSTGGGVGIASTQWYFGDGTTATGTTTSHAYNPAGTYDVSLVVTGVSGCKDSISLPITIYPLPVASFSNSTLCLGDTVFFNESSTVAPPSTITNWLWNFGDGITSSLQDAYHAYTAQNDTFPVTLVVTSNFGCKDTLIQNVVTNPIVAFSFGTPNANGCAPLDFIFADVSTVGGSSTIVGWIWDFGDGTFSFQQNPSHAYLNAGSYTVNLTVTTSDGCTFTSTLSYPITVFPQPIAGFTYTPTTTSIYQPDVDFVDLSTSAIYWEWNFGDMTYTNIINPSHHYNLPGTYTVSQIVTNVYGCSDTAQHLVIILEEATFFAPNAVSPNDDGTNEIFLPMGSGIIDYHLMIFDRWGELIFETYDLTQGWDVTYKGIQVKQDVYVWKAVMTTINGDAQEHRGHVTVIR